MYSVNPMKWKTRTLAYISFVFMIVYILFIHKKTHHLTFEAKIKNSKPKEVWEFVADFSNMMKLNPTIKDFSIIDESGNYDHWKYSVKYTEHLSQFPMIKNIGHGHFSVKPKVNGYLIQSLHKTCFFLDLYCLLTESEFHFDSAGNDTNCKEIINYQCPLALSAICYKEVLFQRHEIVNNLQSHFKLVNPSK